LTNDGSLWICAEECEPQDHSFAFRREVEDRLAAGEVKLLPQSAPRNGRARPLAGIRTKLSGNFAYFERAWCYSQALIRLRYRSDGERDPESKDVVAFVSKSSSKVSGGTG